MSLLAARRRPFSLALAAVAALALCWAAGCEAILGLGSDSNLPDGGADARIADASKDAAPERAPRPKGPVALVSSSRSARNWCAVTFRGDVECWGNNESGQLGDGTTTASDRPVKVRGLPGPVSEVSVGAVSACALTRTGGVSCWGRGAEGEIGDGKSATMSTTAVAVAGMGSGVTALSTGYFVSCAVKGGAVSCWGSGAVGLLGTKGSANAVMPAAVATLAKGVSSVSVGDAVACAVKEGGAVFCWGGWGGGGSLGDGTTRSSAVPVPTKLSAGVVEVSAGDDCVCARTKLGEVFCWGNGMFGTLGNGQFASSSSPVRVEHLPPVTAISAGEDTVSAITNAGDVMTWGYATFGELGNGTADLDSSVGDLGGAGSATPVRVKGLSSPVVSLSTGRAPCVATRDGDVSCWGVTAEDALAPVDVTGLDHVTALAVGGRGGGADFACAASVTTSGHVYCWGSNGSGQLSTGTGILLSTTPTVAFGIEVPGPLAAGVAGNFACGIDATTGEVYCWGDNSAGQLGIGSTAGPVTPTPVSGLPGPASAIAAGGFSACAIVASSADSGPGRALYCWGSDADGQLGDGSFMSSSSAVPVPGLTSGVVGVSVGASSACAVVADGSVRCWGSNSSYQLGMGVTDRVNTPEKVAGVSGATAVAVGWYSTCAVAGGTIVCWGDNTYGELGDGTVKTTFVPQTVSGLNGVATAVAVGTTVACGIVDGTVGCWGQGQLGVGASPAFYALSPGLVVGLDHRATSIAVGQFSACAGLSTGEVRCWGLNSAGQLGNGGPVDSFVPAVVDGFL